MPFSRREALLQRSQLLSSCRRKVEGKMIFTLSRLLAAIALQEQLLRWQVLLPCRRQGKEKTIFAQRRSSAMMHLQNQLLRR
jgi:hypothetical protein